MKPKNIRELISICSHRNCNLQLRSDATGICEGENCPYQLINREEVETLIKDYIVKTRKRLDKEADSFYRSQFAYIIHVLRSLLGEYRVGD